MSGNASTSSAVPPVTVRQSRAPIGSGNHTRLSPCGWSSRQVPSCHVLDRDPALVADGGDARRGRPIRSARRGSRRPRGRSRSRAATSTSARPGAKPHPSPTVTSALFAFGCSAGMASMASWSSSAETHGTPAVIAAVTTAWSRPVGSAQAMASIPSGIGSPGSNASTVAFSPSESATFGIRPASWPASSTSVTPGVSTNCRAVRVPTAPTPATSTLTGTQVLRARANRRSSAARRLCRASVQSDRRRRPGRTPRARGAGLSQTRECIEAPCYDRPLPGAIAQSVRAHR